MRIRTTFLLAVLGIVASSAGALAIPVSPARKAGAIRSDDATVVVAGSETRTPSRFVAGKTMLVDARLGHASVAEGGSQETFLFAQVSGAEARAEDKAPPVNLAIVIDRSGSMKGERIANAIAAAVGSVERMRDGDRVTVVAFDTVAQVLVPPTRVDAQSRSRIESQIRSVRLGGDTCISCGLDEAMRQLETVSLSGDQVNRMVLLSDGAANFGVRDVPGLRTQAARMQRKGFAISTVGVDVDFDEKVMAAIANESNGKHYFVANASGLPKVFSEEFDSLLASVARDAEMVIELAPGVEVAEVFDRTFRREGNRLIVPFGTFSANQEKTVLVKLRVPATGAGEKAVADVKLAYRDLQARNDGQCSGNLAVVVTDSGRAQRDLDPFVAARVERSRTAQTLTEANKLFEQGRIGEARARLAAQAQNLKAKEEANVALALAQPSVAPRRASKSLDRDFEDQLGAVARAEATFAAPPPPAPGHGAGGFAGPSRPPASQPADAAKAQVRANQASATELGF